MICAIALAAIFLATSLALHFTIGKHILVKPWTINDVLLRSVLLIAVIFVALPILVTICIAVFCRSSRAHLSYLRNQALKSYADTPRETLSEQLKSLEQEGGNHVFSSDEEQLLFLCSKLEGESWALNDSEDLARYQRLFGHPFDPNYQVSSKN